LLATDPDRREELLSEAIKLIGRIQAATPLAFERNSIASQLTFDTEKLGWELDYFKMHYFTTLKGRPLSTADDNAITGEFAELSTKLECFARMLCHRDFHAANLMLDQQGRMRIIDHQDARLGSAAYDLVSLLLDRITELPDEGWLAKKKGQFLNDRVAFGCQPEISDSEFDHEFQLQTIQRCLKAAGTFSYQSAVRGKTHFLPFIKPMFEAALSAARELDRFGTMRSVLEREIEIT
jgi:aminoglycoside/choline kinase family phosphotransferase